MLSSTKLNTMRQMQLDEIDKNTLVDVRDVRIDTTLPQAERVEKYMDLIRNPYIFKSGDTTVRIRFVGEKSLSQSLTEYFSRLNAQNAHAGL